MTFTVDWMSSEGRVSVVLPTVLDAYQEAERVTKLGMRDVSVRLPNGDLIDWQTFRCRSDASNQTTDGIDGLD